ncbi:MAG: DinB family protein [Chloroflexota bacterium]
MNPIVKDSIWQQFGAAIDFLALSIDACPDELWTAPLWKTTDDEPTFAQFWYVAYHTLFWLDLYLTGTEDGFAPPEPFTIIEETYDGPLPKRVYTKAELMGYVATCRERTHTTIMALTDETAARECAFGWGSCSFLELLLYNARHVHGHASQLNMLLGQHDVPVRDWVARARSGA